MGVKATAAFTSPLASRRHDHDTDCVQSAKKTVMNMNSGGLVNGSGKLMVNH